MAEQRETPKPSPAEREAPTQEDLSHAMQEALRVTANMPDGEEKNQIIADAAREEGVNTEQMKTGGVPPPVVEPEPTTRATKPADKPADKPAS